VVAASALLLLCSWSCASSGPRPASATGTARDTADVGDESAPRFWGLPEDALATQRVVKLRYEGPDGDATLNLILRLERQDRFSLQGNDQLGRSWFRLAVDETRALFLDLRAKTFCRFDEAIEIEAVPLGPLPFDQLPALLLGQLPIQPVEHARIGGESWRLVDSAGRAWTADAPAGRLERWTLWRAGEPEVWWHRGASLSYLSARSDGLQLRWRTPGGQPLTQTPASLEVPEGFVASEDCGGSPELPRESPRE
jgi:hypothetical protein